MTRTAEIILEHIGSMNGEKDGHDAAVLLGRDLYQDETFRNWCLAGFKAALDDGRNIALVAVASNFIRLGYKVAMQELSEGRQA